MCDTFPPQYRGLVSSCPLTARRRSTRQTTPPCHRRPLPAARARAPDPVPVHHPRHRRNPNSVSPSVPAPGIRLAVPSALEPGRQQRPRKPRRSHARRLRTPNRLSPSPRHCRPRPAAGRLTSASISRCAAPRGQWHSPALSRCAPGSPSPAPPRLPCARRRGARRALDRDYKNYRPTTTMRPRRSLRHARVPVWRPRARRRGARPPPALPMQRRGGCSRSSSRVTSSSENKQPHSPQWKSASASCKPRCPPRT